MTLNREKAIDLQMYLIKLKYIICRFLINCTFGKFKAYLKNKKAQYKEIIYTDMIEFDNSNNKYKYEYLRNKGIQIRNDYSVNSEISDIVNFSILNKLKEIELKKKIQVGQKIRVCFLIDNESKLSILPVYEQMCNSNIFEPFIVLYHDKDTNFNDTSELSNIYKQEILKSYKNFQNKNYNLFLGYDEKFNIIPIDNFYPDIVFLSAAYMDFGGSYFSNVLLNTNYLVCYMNYALNTINFYDYHYNNKAIAGAWKHFVETRDDYYELIKYSKYFGTNAILTGYPKMDDYGKSIEQCNIPPKIDNGNPIVIYAPHWTITHKEECTNLSTFHHYYKYFINLANKTPNINFVFKPHSNLLGAVEQNCIMSLKEYEKYNNEWNNLPNGMVITSGDYIDLFRKSDLMITDCSSFIGEWLPTDKPCIYLVKPERNQKTYMDGFSLMGRKILEKYYLAHNQEEIDKYFKMIMFDKQDPMKEERTKLKDELFINIGCAGQKIVDYLTEILTD